MTYSEKLKHPKWQKKRLEILNRDNFTCQYCKDTETQLQVHHIAYTEKEPHDEPSENLITLCSECHKIAEYLKRQYKDDPLRDSAVLLVNKRINSTVLFQKGRVLVFDKDTCEIVFNMNPIFLNDVNRIYNELI